MVVQFEDCIDVLQHLYPDFDFVVFLFDHSNGHEQKQPNGLNLKRLNFGFGGTQPHMRDTVITPDLLGPYHNLTSHCNLVVYNPCNLNLLILDHAI